METDVVKINPAAPEQPIIAQAAALLRDGELVAFPTETVYGLGADALSETAVQKIFAAKERPADNPLIVHLADPADADRYARDISDETRKLIRAFWPGPLSLVLKKHSLVPDTTTASLDTVVLRCPSHPVAQALITAAGVPIAAPSANRSGRVSTTRAEHVHEDLAGRVPLILDAGPVEYGLESTVLDCTEQPLRILRYGSVTSELLEAVIGEALATGGDGSEAHRSPGTCHQHYAPLTPLLLTSTTDAFTSWLASQSNLDRIGVIHHSPISYSVGSAVLLSPDPAVAAPHLNAALRELDQKQLDAIVVEGYAEIGIGRALMDRLRRGAREII